ncbi:putative holin-like toxin [Xylocopilactobacillus apis]
MILQLHSKGKRSILSVYETLCLMIMFGGLIVSILKYKDR